MALNPRVTDQSAWRFKTGPGVITTMMFIRGTTYGKLYNWYAVMGITVKEDARPQRTNSCKKTLAPAGWHVPSDEEWTTLTTFLGNAGAKKKVRKENGRTHWWVRQATNAVVLQLFREVSLQQWSIQRHWQLR
jgi:uncharacterized protein (TIGR02145 family)